MTDQNLIIATDGTLPNVDKYVDANEFLDAGYLQEINRLVLHPLGIDLVINMDAAGPSLSMLARDFRESDDQLKFHGDLKPRAEAIDAERSRRKRPRKEALGYVIQPRE